MIEEVKYNGLTTVPSDYECQDGDLAGALNTIVENDSLNTILPPKSFYTPPTGYQVKFIHKVGEKTNYILWNDDNTLAYDKGGKAETIKTILNIRSINAIGNTLIVLANDAMHYILWKSDKREYIYLGTQIPDFPISFGLQGHVRFYSVSRDDENKFNPNEDKLGFFEVTFDEIVSINANLDKDLTEDNSKKITDQVLAKVNSFIAEQSVNKGRFCFPFFIRYALRLYDGTLVNHSAPILMMPSTRICPLVFAEQWDETSGKLDIMLVAADIDYKVIQSTEATEVKDKWGDIVKDVEVYISKPIYTYNQNGKIKSLKTSPYVAMQDDTYFVGKVFADGVTLSKAEDKVFELIESDIGPIQKYYEWNYTNLFFLFNPISNGNEYTRRLIGPDSILPIPRRELSDIEEDIRNTSSFYLLKSIPFEKLSLTERKKIDVSDSYLQSLTSRQTMTDDYLSHDKIVPTYSFPYNNRLNFANIRRWLYNGYNPVSMVSYVEGSYKFDVTMNQLSNIVTEFSDSKQYTLIVQTYIKDDLEDRVVSAIYDDPFRLMSINKFCSNDYGYRKGLQSWGSYLFYPNINAYKMIITDSDGNYFIASLKPHDFLNGAFAYIGMPQYRDPSTETKPIALTSRIVVDPNKVYTSEVNNPFYFPVTGINTVGTGEIIGVSAAVKALSQGQFGQFPMYVFASDGVWAIETSATGSFIAKQPVTRDVCICPESITQIDSAVLFATQRGIMMLQGSTATCISNDLDGDVFDITSLPHLSDVLQKKNIILPNIIDFKDYISDCRMVYDYINQRIVVFRPDTNYAYVFSLKSQSWSMMNSNMANNINSYPDAYVVLDNGSLANLSNKDSESLPAMFVTRPMKFRGANIFKTVRKAIQRGMVETNDVAHILYGSRNLFNWFPIASSQNKYLNNISGTPYKYFRLAVFADFDKDKSLYGCSFDIVPKLNNKIR